MYLTIGVNVKIRRSRSFRSPVRLYCFQSASTSEAEILAAPPCSMLFIACSDSRGKVVASAVDLRALHPQNPAVLIRGDPALIGGFSRWLERRRATLSETSAPEYRDSCLGLHTNRVFSSTCNASQIALAGR